MMELLISQWGLIVAGDGQMVLRLAQEIIVQGTMLIVMHCCRPDRCPVLQLTHSSS